MGYYFYLAIMVSLNAALPRPEWWEEVKGDAPKRATWEETLAAALPGEHLEFGPWWAIGPFDNRSGSGFAWRYRPERMIELNKTCQGLAGPVAWQERAEWPDGSVIDLLPLFTPHDDVCCYLTRTVTAPADVEVTVWTGSDDTITLWVNGKQVLSKDVARPCRPRQESTPVRLRAGENRLLLKICQGKGDFGFYWEVEVPRDARARIVALEMLLERFPKDPRVPTTHVELASLYRQQGEQAWAEKHLDKVLADPALDVDTRGQAVRQQRLLAGTLFWDTFEGTRVDPLVWTEVDQREAWWYDDWEQGRSAEELPPLRAEHTGTNAATVADGLLRLEIDNTRGSWRNRRTLVSREAVPLAGPAILTFQGEHRDVNFSLCLSPDPNVAAANGGAGFLRVSLDDRHALTLDSDGFGQHRPLYGPVSVDPGPLTLELRLRPDGLDQFLVNGRPLLLAPLVRGGAWDRFHLSLTVETIPAQRQRHYVGMAVGVEEVVVEPAGA